MKEERMMILQMLSEEKISAEEAENLILALSKSEKPHWHAPNIDIDKEKFNEKMGQFAESMDTFAKDFSSKAHEVYKDVEPKLRSAAKTLIEKTASLADEVSKNLNESIRKMDEDAGKKCDCGCQDHQHQSSDVVYNKPEDENNN
ncbi:MAG: hypothetical protein FWE20_01170 [Defluviitaleaceae bacterium]|nr:hypothetical protein [Defluviitaleaceae bacterium]